MHSETAVQITDFVSWTHMKMCERLKIIQFEMRNIVFWFFLIIENVRNSTNDKHSLDMTQITSDSALIVHCFLPIGV